LGKPWIHEFRRVSLRSRLREAQEKSARRDGGYGKRACRCGADGAEIRDEHWSFFTRCYNNTYRAHHSTPYLNLEFFRRLGETLPEHLMMVLAELDGKPIASSLNIFSPLVLYGRYWGSIGHVPLLHFEVCYYQALEFLHRARHPCLRGGRTRRAQARTGIHAEPPRGLRTGCVIPSSQTRWKNFLPASRREFERYVDELAERSPFRTKN